MTKEITPILEDYASAWNEHDVDKLVSFFDDNCVYEDLATENIRYGKEEVRAFLSDLFVSFPDVRFEHRSVFASGNRGLREWSMSGTFTGSTDVMKIMSTGKLFSIRGASVLEFRGGRISRNSDYWNFSSFQQQVNADQPHMGDGHGDGTAT